MANETVREYAKEKGVKHWEIAARLGMFDNTFSKKLRFELSDEMREKVINAIDTIASEKGSSAAVSN